MAMIELFMVLRKPFDTGDYVGWWLKTISTMLVPNYSQNDLCEIIIVTSKKDDN